MIAVVCILGAVVVGVVLGCCSEMSEQRRLKGMAKDVGRRG